MHAHTHTRTTLTHTALPSPQTNLYTQWLKERSWNCMPYRLGFSPQPQQNILVSHPRINPAPWKCLIYTNPAQGFLPDRLQITPKIPVFQSRTPKFKRYFCARSHPAGQKTIFLRGDIKSVRYSITHMRARTHTHTHTHTNPLIHTHKHT